MKKIDYYIDHIKEELCGAKEYAEKYIEYKLSKPTWAKMYNEMALAELTHARYLKEMGEQCWAELSQTYTAHDVVEDWEKCMNKYTDKVAWIKQMLAM